MRITFHPGIFLGILVYIMACVSAFNGFWFAFAINTGNLCYMYWNFPESFTFEVEKA